MEGYTFCNVCFYFSNKQVFHLINLVLVLSNVVQVLDVEERYPISDRSTSASEIEINTDLRGCVHICFCMGEDCKTVCTVIYERYAFLMRDGL